MTSTASPLIFVTVLSLLILCTTWINPCFHHYWLVYFLDAFWNWSDQPSQQHIKTLLSASSLEAEGAHQVLRCNWIPQKWHGASCIRRYPATVWRRLEGRQQVTELQQAFLRLPMDQPDSGLQGEACTGGSPWLWALKLFPQDELRSILEPAAKF
jgi:hypothetical protein